ncbi:MAG: SAM-dependent methyltransferase [Desulfocapsaceae bacterium]
MWNQRYSEPGFAYGTAPNDFLVASTVLLQPESEVLCLAEGEGRNAVYLATLGHRVTAVDSSAVGLEKAHSLAQEQSVAIQTIEADLDDFIINSGSFQAIVSIFCHLPPAVRTRLHQKVCKGLVPGGIFILEGFAQKQIEFDTGGPRNIDLLMDLEELKQELDQLELKHAIETERHIHEGEYHHGNGAIVQIIGTKQR